VTTTKLDLERGWKLPADVAPFAGGQLRYLAREHRFRDTVLGATVKRDPPEWCADRRADAWLVSEDASVVCPLLWTENGELTCMVVLHRDRAAPPARKKERRWMEASDVPDEGLIRISRRRQVVISEHARARFAERVGDADLLRAMLRGDAHVTRRPPVWKRASTSAFAWLHLAPDVAAPLVVGDDGALVAVTFVDLESSR
jgi:hypothetical protein